MVAMLLVDIGCVDDFTAAVFGGRDCVAIVDCSPLQATPRGSVGPASSISTVKDSGSVSLCGGRSDGIAHGRWSRGSLREARCATDGAYLRMPAYSGWSARWCVQNV